jgi:hypothetical protein
MKIDKSDLDKKYLITLKVHIFAPDGHAHVVFWSKITYDGNSAFGDLILPDGDNELRISRDIVASIVLCPQQPPDKGLEDYFVKKTGYVTTIRPWNYIYVTKDAKETP